ncbi:UDP-glucose/GDP-mannose dehydrogenase family protein [Candidatus Dependentiae bacterium]|nr:UDP-glucose/GDP-mannose dehydrogenase family protein [Candidatus Dependentiae bacterium]
MNVRTIAVIGAGYVGLVTGACFAQKGNRVIVVENNQSKIDQLLQGSIPFYEPGLDVLVSNCIKEKTLQFVKNIYVALQHKPELIFSCVGTPPLASGAADLSYVWNVAREIGRTITDYCVVINKSTVPVGTALQVKHIIQEELQARGVSVNFDVASNPEFLKEGDALSDFLQPDRVVIGTESERARTALEALYKPFLHTEGQLVCMNIPSAELTKYASNAMLATRISFMNQIALLADKVGADIDQIKQGMAKDRRIGPHFLNAGIGYGGSCFPKDVKALLHTGTENEQEMSLVKEVDAVNELQRKQFIQTIINHYDSSIGQKKVGIWGLAFKPETDDIRCAPSLDVINALLEHGAKVYAYDPVAMPNIKAQFEKAITYTRTADEILELADFLIVLTEWKEFIRHEPAHFTKLTDKTVFDGRNCFDPTLMTAAGLTYFCIGRNQSTNTSYALLKFDRSLSRAHQ